MSDALGGWRGRAVVLAAWVMASASGAHGQPMQGDREIQVGLSVFHAQGSSSGNVALDLGIGYFLTDGWELGFMQGLNYQFIDGSRDAWSAASIPFVNYHFQGLFENEGIVPFLGAFAGANWNDRDATGTAGPNVGIKFFLSAQTFLATRYRYEYFFSSLRLAGEDSSADGNHVLTAGLGFVWGAPERVLPAMRDEAFINESHRILRRAENAAERAEEAARRAAKAAEEAREEAGRVDGAETDGGGERGR